MTDALRPAIVAVAGGVIVAIVLAVPFVAVEYRRFGRLTVRSALVGFAVAVYGCALATYTLLPLPETAGDFCARYGVPPQLVPFRFVADVLRIGVGSPAAVVRNAAVQQVLLNVALFAPLGVILRRIPGWRVPTVAAAGLAVSLLIETTQLTGIWTLFPCAYRVADVDDLIANTAGALLGALLAPLLGRRRPATAPAEDRPTSVSLGRRLTGMLCDVAVVVALGAVVTLLWTAPLAILDRRLDQPWDDVLSLVTQAVVPAAVQLGFLLVSGQTVGEQAVRVQPVARPPRARLLARWLLGIGGWTLLGATPTGPAAPLLALASLAVLLAQPSRRGLAYLVAGLRVRVSPPPVPQARGAAAQPAEPHS